MSQTQRIIIDGYNVIHADEALHRKAAHDLDGARRDLIERLKNYVERRDLRMTVVFDGRGGLVDAESVVGGALQLLFSAAGQSADDLILQTLRGSSNARAYIVVTSDMADIGKAARAMGCQVIGSKRFLDRIGPPDPAVRRGPKEEPAVDLDYWLRKFGPEETDDT
jgi:predicted RNA-binding protein with PIN domain